jgi:hypothetical protein
MRKTVLLFCTAFFAFAVPSVGIALDIRNEIVKFDTGKSGTVIKQSIKGYETVVYKLSAKAGQSMKVAMIVDNSGAYFNIYAPGKGPGGEAILTSDMVGQNGVSDINKAELSLPADGEYSISVYLVRAAARRNEVANYTLDISIGVGGAASGETAVQLPIDLNATPVSQGFTATGIMPCARDAGQPMGQCNFGVKREADGNGMITIAWPDGGSRVIFYEDMTPMSFDKSQADGDAEMTVSEESDLFTVRIGDQRFEFPEAIMAGG